MTQTQDTQHTGKLKLILMDTSVDQNSIEGNHVTLYKTSAKRESTLSATEWKSHVPSYPSVQLSLPLNGICLFPAVSALGHREYTFT